MSPFRANKLKFKAKKQETKLDGFDSFGIKKGTTMRPQVRKISHGLERSKTDAYKHETPKFALSSGNKNSGSGNTASFGDLNKSRSAGGAPGKIDLGLDSSQKKFLPKLDFGDSVIHEEESRQEYSPSMMFKGM